MSHAKLTRHTPLTWLEKDRLGDLAALIFAIVLAIAVAALLPL